MPVRIEDVIHDTDNGSITSHWVRPTSWVKELMRLYPGCLTGGFQDSAKIGLQLRAFWESYRKYHGEHAIFSSPNNSRLDRVIPLALFGDEGRGPKRGQFLVWSMEAVLGLDEHVKTCSCEQHLSELPPLDIPVQNGNVGDALRQEDFHRACKQSTNNKNHSFLTRHVLFGLPHWYYKRHPAVEHEHIKLMVEDLKDLFASGVDVGGVRYYGCIVGSKGDFKHQVAIGNLDRSYNTFGTRYGNLMCSLCQAGAPGFPFELVEHEPRWAPTMFNSRPWSSTPILTTIDFDSTKPEHLLKLDFFHLWKVGLGRDFVGSCVVLFCRVGLFDDGSANESKDIDSRLERAHYSFRLWALVNSFSPGLQSFSKAFFSIKSFADSPWSNSKGSDTVMLSKWVAWVAGLHLSSPTVASQKHVRLLKLVKHTAQHSFHVMEILYDHGLWLHKTCAKHLYWRLFMMLKG